VNVGEDAFMYSLNKVHDRAFIRKLIPNIKRQQDKHSPVGCAASKSPFLLKNTFSYDMYKEFLRQQQTLSEKQSELSPKVPKIKVSDPRLPKIGKRSFMEVFNSTMRKKVVNMIQAKVKEEE